MASSCSRFERPLIGILAAGLVAGCAGEDAQQQQAKFPRAPGSDAFNEMLADDAQEQQERAQDGKEAVSAIGPDGQPIALDDTYADADPSALTDFRGALDPHGDWVDDPTYGTMWQPSQSEVGSDFAPYVSGGHWAYDDSDEYVWMSDYGWGWAPFHYGRWVYGGSGWGWIPGRAYAPAWVSWRTGPPGFGYVGWAPMAPTWYWGPGGVAFGLGTIPATPYAFCGVHDLFAPSGLQGRIVSQPLQLSQIAGQTRTYSPSGTRSPSSPSSPASTAPGGRVPAHPTVTGPSPQSLHLGAGEVARVPNANPQLAHAMQFARPSTAERLGAHAPTGSAFASGAFHGGTSTPTTPGRGAGATIPAASGGAVAGHAQLARPSMPAYGGSAHTYYNSGHYASTTVGDSYYGHGGTYRSFDAPTGSRGSAGGGAGAVAHPATQYAPPAAVPHTTTSGGHFGGHYGGGAHGGGGHR
jgi:hypothetical protein